MMRHWTCRLLFPRTDRFVLVAAATALLLPACWARSADGERPVPAPSAEAAPPEADLQGLVKDLGDSSWKVREAAQAKLTAAGKAAVAPLEKAVESEDPEVRQRAQSILQEIRKNLAEGASAAVAKARLWKSPVPDGVASPAAVSGGTVCFLSFDGTLRAVDANTGKPRWTFEDLVKESQPRNQTQVIYTMPTLPAPVISGGLVVAASHSGRAYAIDLASGDLKWKSATGDGFAPPAVADGRVFLGGVEDGDFRALDLVSGKEIWKADLGAGCAARPVVIGGAVFAATRNGEVFALDANIGQRRAVASELADVTGLAVLPGGLLGVRTGDAVVCLDPETGRQKWSYSLPGDPVAARNALLIARNARAANNRRAGPPIGEETLLAAGDVVYTVGGGQVHAIASADGKGLWTFQPRSKEEDQGGDGPNGMVVNIQAGGAIIMGGQGRFILRGMGAGGLTMPCVDGGTMYLASPMGLHAVDLKSRAELWRLEGEGGIVARPTVADGVLYYGTSDLSGGGAVGNVVMVANVNGQIVQQQKAIGANAGKADRANENADAAAGLRAIRLDGVAK